MIKKMFFTALLVSVALVFTALVPVFAYELRDPAIYDFADVQMWYSNGEGPQKLATGACYGPYKEFVNDRGVKIGDVFRTCAMVTYDAVNSAKEESVSGGVALNLFSVMGVTGSVFQDPFNGDWNWGMGVSVMEVMKSVTGTKQLEKVLETSRRSSDRSIVFYSSESLDRNEVSDMVDRLDIDFVRIKR